MTWLDAIILIAVLAGLFAGAALVARSPTFWLGMGTAIFKAVFPEIVKFVSKRMSPEEEAEWREAVRRGQGDEFLRKRNRNLRDK